MLQLVFKEVIPQTAECGYETLEVAIESFV